MTFRYAWIIKITLVVLLGVLLFASFALAEEAAPTGSSLPTAEQLQFDTVAGWIYTALTTIGALVASLGGRILDISLAWFVFGMKGTTTYFGLQTVILNVWELIRDLFNLAFIFGIIWVGLQIILEVNEGAAKRTLGSIIIAALLINFSLYATQVVVDIGNIAAAEIGSLLDVNTKPSKVLGLEVIDVSSGFIAATNLQNLSADTLKNSGELSTGERALPNRALGIGDALVLGLSIAFMLILLGIVFAAGAFLMFMRFMYLIFLMMFSPFMFLGSVLPKLQSATGKLWSWNSLFRNVFVGPAYLFMLYIALLALRGLQAKQTEGNVSLMAFIISSLFVCAFAWAALLAARQMGAHGAAQTINFANSVRGMATGYLGGASLGGAGRALRSTVGRWSQQYSESDKAKDRAVNSWLGRRTLNITRKLGDASFDARQAPVVGKQLSSLGLGTGRKGGYATLTKETVEAEKKYAEGLGTVGDKDGEVTRLQLEVDATDQQIKQKRDQVKKEREALQKGIDDGKGTGTLRPLTDDEKRARRGVIGDIEAEIKALESTQKDQKEGVQKEKYRRQLGSSARIPLLVNRVTAAKDDLKKLTADYAAARDIKNVTEQTRLRGEIATKKKDIADLEKEVQKNDGSYASTVENLSTIKSFFLGRDTKQNAAAGKAIRDEYKKKTKGEDKK